MWGLILLENSFLFSRRAELTLNKSFKIELLKNEFSICFYFMQIGN
ncbi:hypothetical protein LEP1GSC166_2670 [Leptospira kirschneri]|nr:hypothetical protein LEP1GSC198_1107 [Leptospira kirschneri str. JB]EMK04115.1 hypothetical protein LEP1GSC166_2670 [Leptospira kirschneri]